MPSSWPVLRRLAIASVLLAAGCSSRTVPDDDMAGSDDTADDSMVDPQVAGTQPPGPGTMYSPCEASAECPPLEFCVFPQGESGFCTSACAAPTDPSNCDAAPGNQTLACFDIGLPDGRQVCALDCGGVDCPVGMRCEQVQSGGSGRSICF